MSYVPPIDDTRARPRLPRLLDPIETRVLGALMEKQLTTPEVYPLTLNALVIACNQKSNREPVMALDEAEAGRAVERLQEEKLVWRVLGGRATRFDHNLDALWHITPREKALLTLLLLRGPQTPGELRGRSERLHPFDSVGEVETLLREMAAQSEPLVAELPRRPGQKESRWSHLAGGPVADIAGEPEAAAPRVSGEPLAVRVQRLEEQVAALHEELRALRAQLGG